LRKKALLPLQDYRAKRSAGQTNEPFGGGSGPSLLFVVHKHAARRLHYDLRLEMEGVLRSWAVPRVPSFDPAEKRLAVQVEDHPIEYGSFEGVIPAGNYGAGPTIVWDRGTWTPLGDVEQGLAKGKLRFTFAGYKLRGAWSLVRLAKSQKDWLLIKERDAYVVRGDASSLAETSVLSGLTIEELRDGSSRWAEVRAQVEKLPPSRLRAEKVQLMLAEARPQPFSEAGWIFEIKYDGFRALAAHEGGRGKLLYRHGSDATALYPDLVAALAALPADVVLDGEIAVCDEQGRPSFERLQRRALLTRQPDIERAALSLPASLFVFDLLGFEDRDLRSLPLSRRKALLSRLLPALGPLHYVDHIETRGQEMFEEIARLGLEGVMAKRAESPYRAGRSQDWLKIRRDRSADFAVVGYTAPRGLRSGLGALHLAAQESGALVYAGRVGSGLHEKDLARLPQELHDDEQSEPPCSGPAPRGPGYTWVRPRLVCEVRYKEITGEGLLRQPTFLRWRADKRPEECVRPVAQAEPPLAKSEVEKRIAFTNLNKVFWPEQGFTKGDLIDYYRAIAPWLLPYLRDRPLVLTRYPEGIDGPSFFQKDAPTWSPDWVRRVRIWSDERQGELEYFLCDDVESILYLANLGTIPLHLWASRVGSLEKPDWCILDLDPKDAPFAHVVQLARAIHQLCGRIQLPCFAKTSGGSGLHVLIPLAGQLTHAESRTLAQLFGQVMVREHPDLCTLTRAVAQRAGRVYLDCLQNGHGKTIAGPFSARAVPGARVSMPLRWPEVNARLDPAAFTIKTAPARMKRLREDPLAPVLQLRPDLPRALALLEGEVG
jgi:bifunctional non-homologous end joining protein LigD